MVYHLLPQITDYKTLVICRTVKEKVKLAVGLTPSAGGLPSLKPSALHSSGSLHHAHQIRRQW